MRFFGFAGRKPVVVHNWRGHSIDFDHVAAHPIAHADLAEFQPRRGFVSPVAPFFARLERLTTRQRRNNGVHVCRFGAIETQPLFCVLEYDT